MDTIATVKGITSAQAGRVSDRFLARCRKESTTLPRDTVQIVLDDEMEGLVNEMFTALRTRVERRLKVIVRRIPVDRSRSPQAVLNATGRKKYVTDSVVVTMPKGQGGEVEVHFFKPDKSAYNENGWINDEGVEQQFALRDLVPVDPYSLAAVNKSDPGFADEYPNATHWKDENDKWCYAAFYRWSGERGVSVYQSDDGWNDYWWFAGLRKSSQNSTT